MASTTQKITKTTESAIPMTRFSISEDDEEAPLTFKRVRFSEPPSQLQTSVHPSQSRVTTEEDEEDHEDEDFIPVEDVESDSQVSEEEVNEEVEVCEDVRNDDDDDDVGDRAEVELASEGQNQRRRMCSSIAPSLPRGISNVGDARQRSPTTSSVYNNVNGELQVVLTDPDVLDCPICLDPLCTPVFQCENGHIACSSCCRKVKRKCPTCCLPIGYNRCRAIEKVIESVKVSCRNTQYGCTETMAYNKKSEHEQMCPRTACFCPYSSCSYVDYSKNLYFHFGIQHAASTTRFTFDTPFDVYVSANQNHIFLQEQHESVIFILNHQVKEHDRAFDVDCVGPDVLKSRFVYQLTTKNMEATLFLQCVPKIYTKWSKHTLKKNYLTIPSDFSSHNGTLCLQVCIKKAISLV